jgi:acyl-homoserine lactone acylase PvdQ
VLAYGQGQSTSALDLALNLGAGQRPGSFTSQAAMYNRVVTSQPTGDLQNFYKDSSFAQITGTSETPVAGATVVRDPVHQVPHIYGTTRAAAMFAAGYATAQDRLFLMDVLRHTGRARLTELIGPGEDDANVKADAEQLKVADYDEGELQAMIDRAREAAGPEGATIQADLDAYVAGVNQYIQEARTDPSKLPAEYPALG